MQKIVIYLTDDEKGIEDYIEFQSINLGRENDGAIYAIENSVQMLPQILNSCHATIDHELVKDGPKR